MEKAKTVIVNGRHYDQATGLPITSLSTDVKDTPSPKGTPTGVKDFAEVAVKVAPKERVATSATTVHSAPQRSQTLNRRVAAKNTPAKRPTKTGRTMDIARSGRIARFAPHPADVSPQKEAESVDHPPVSHPMAARAVNRHVSTAVTSPQPTLSSKEIKKKAIDKALAAPTPSKKPVKKGGFWIRHLRLWVILASLIVISGVASYAILVNLPVISVSIADSQAGIAATYPTYTPDGFALQQPVNYSDGQVTLKFAAAGNGKNDGYTIVQKGSSWDSSAVLQNIVLPAAGPNYATIQDSGLTIYTYNHTATWVNNSILYTITTTAALSNEQIRNIATSL